MVQQSLPYSTQKLFELICHEDTLTQAFAYVKRNKGAPGIDNVTVLDFDAIKLEEIAKLREELESWSYKPQPVKRVTTPKPDGKGVRLLGIPCVRDRVVQAAIKLTIEPILDPRFSEHSYGFRPKRSQRQAIEAARQHVEAGKEHIVDIDLSKFFDRINHDRLIAKLRKVIEDKRVLRLIGLTLRSGVLTSDGYEPTDLGAAQGSPLSPLLSNVILDELDKELERREISFVRYADDSIIFTSSRKAAERVMRNISHFIEKRMKLVINKDKSKVASPRKVTFLGVTFVMGKVAISKAALQHAKSVIKKLTKRGTNKTLEDTLRDFNSWYMGWSTYFEVASFPAQFKTIEAHVRRRLRARIVSQMKRRKSLFRKLKVKGVKRKTAAKTAFSNMGRWALSRTNAVENAFSNEYFEMAGMFIKSSQNLRHWFSVNYWVHLS